jgi:hypothetical protein
MAALTGYRKRWLLDGGGDLGFPDSCEGDPSEAELHNLWREHGEALTAEHVGKFPGSRPWAFWKFTKGVEPPKDELECLTKSNLLLPDERQVVIEKLSRWGWTTATLPLLRTLQKGIES